MRFHGEISGNQSVALVNRRYLGYGIHVNRGFPSIRICYIREQTGVRIRSQTRREDSRSHENTGRRKIRMESDVVQIRRERDQIRIELKIECELL
jgi:hypothetical protein